MRSAMQTSPLRSSRITSRKSSSLTVYMEPFSCVDERNAHQRTACARAARSTKNYARIRVPYRNTKTDSEVGVGLRRRRGEDLCKAYAMRIEKRFSKKNCDAQDSKCCVRGASYYGCNRWLLSDGGEIRLGGVVWLPTRYRSVQVNYFGSLSVTTPPTTINSANTTP
jgi:hypothetical protein